MLKVLIYGYLTNLYSSRKIEQALADKPVDKKVKQKLNYARKNWPENLYYNPDQDCYYCPMGQSMTFAGTRQHHTANGYIQTKRAYQAQNCRGCPMRGSCHKATGNRKIEVNYRLIRY